MYREDVSRNTGIRARRDWLDREFQKFLAYDVSVETVSIMRHAKSLRQV